MSEQSKHVTVTLGAEGFRTEIKAGSHTFYADEPEEVGGSNQGPDPYSYVLAAIGSCTVMTLRMYAKRKEWPLTSVEVVLEQDHDYEKDCEHCEEETAKIHAIKKTITLHGELDDKQRERLHYIADRCPVQRTLEGEVRVYSQLA